MGFKIKKTVNGETVWQPINSKKYTTSKITEYTGTLPITITADGTALIDYCIYGNTVQDGTPTPENPIIPSGCGELETTGVHAGQYKLLMLSNSTITNIYLGEVETTRRIKKLVLTGEEYITYQPEYSCFFFTRSDAYYTGTVRTTPCVCSHYQSIHDGRAIEDVPNESIYVTMAHETAFHIKTTDFTNVSDFKSYLAAQYAAGTPVTVWYVLAEPETGIVNEPLMKIGDYSDMVSMEQAGVSIPTFTGTTVIDYDGTPKPSEMYIKYNSWSGWGDIDNYKMVNENWTQEVT